MYPLTISYAEYQNNSSQSKDLGQSLLSELKNAIRTYYAQTIRTSTFTITQRSTILSRAVLDHPIVNSLIHILNGPVVENIVEILAYRQTSTFNRMFSTESEPLSRNHIRCYLFYFPQLTKEEREALRTQIRTEDGWEHRTTWGALLNSSSRQQVHVYSHPATNRMLVMINTINHMFFCKLLVFLYRFYKDIIKPNEQEMLIPEDLLQAVATENTSLFWQTVQLWTKQLRQQLSGKLRDQALAKTEEQITSTLMSATSQQVARLEESIQQMFIKIKELEESKQRELRKQFNLRYTDQPNPFAELFDFIKRNNKPYMGNAIHARIHDERLLILMIETPCTNYDADMMQRYINNPDSRMQRLKKYFEQLFLSGRYILWFRAICGIDLASNEFHMFKLERSGTTEILAPDASYIRQYLNYPRLGMPNPHAEEYSCLGSNKSEIIRFLRQKWYAQAFAQIISAYSTLNISDSTVLNRFCGRLEEGHSRYTTVPCIYDTQEDKYITFKELVSQ